MPAIRPRMATAIDRAFPLRSIIMLARRIQSDAEIGVLFLSSRSRREAHTRRPAYVLSRETHCDFHPRLSTS